MPKILSDPEIHEFREQLCEAATRLFSERGRDGFTIRELAAALGVSAMTPYRYFRDKEEILAAVRARVFDRFAATLEAAYPGRGNAIEKSRAVGKAYVKFAFEEPAAYRMMFDLAQPDEQRFPDLIRATERARATMTRHVRPMIEEGILAGDPALIGHIMWASLHGAVVLQMAGKLSETCDFSRIIEESFRVLLRGFAAERCPG
jgi:AcrR family transcriptional regulator